MRRLAQLKTYVRVCVCARSNVKHSIKSRAEFIHREINALIWIVLVLRERYFDILLLCSYFLHGMLIIDVSKVRNRILLYILLHKEESVDPALIKFILRGMIR